MRGSFRERMSAYLPKGRVARSIMALISGTAAAQLITICAMPVVTRLYTPDQMGVVSLFLAFFGFWSGMLSFRYENALLIAENDRESHLIQRIAVICVLLMSFLALPALWGLHRFNVFGFGLLPWWASTAVAPILLGYGLFMVYRSWALRANLIKAVTAATISRASARAGTQVGLGFALFGVPGLFMAEFAGAWGALIALRRRVIEYFYNSRPDAFSVHALMMTCQKYRKFPMFEAPSTFLNQLATVLPLPMIASLHGAAAAGWFGLARSLVAIPNTQIGGAVADVLQMEIANAIASGDKERGRIFFYGALRRLSLFGLLPLVAVVFFTPIVMPLIFGQAWAPAGWAAAIIAPWLYSALVVSSLSRVLSVLQSQEYKLIYDFSALTFFTVAFGAAFYLKLDFLKAVVGFSLAGVCAYLLYLLVLIFVVNKKLS